MTAFPHSNRIAGLYRGKKLELSKSVRWRSPVSSRCQAQGRHRAVEGGGEGAVELAFLNRHGAVTGDDMAGGDEQALLDGQGADVVRDGAMPRNFFPIGRWPTNCREAHAARRAA